MIFFISVILFLFGNKIFLHYLFQLTFSSMLVKETARWSSCREGLAPVSAVLAWYAVGMGVVIAQRDLEIC
jgi:hypothetical protein